MPATSIPKSALDFLKELRENNNREWFTANKSRYQAEHAHVVEFAEALLARMGQHDQLEPMTGKQSLFRIYRDVRFSKDKSPYKTHFSGTMKRDTKWLRGGYYFHIEPGGSFVGGGFWGPSSADLKRIRQELAADAEPVRKIIAAPEFVETFGQLDGEQLKTAPQGYSQDHPNIDLLRYKQFLLSQSYTDKEVTSPGLLDKMVLAFQRMRPFFDYMSEVLTTDENGVPIE
ncbi:MAG: DUF2461 domain-containing protein [Lewinellaceae bacterium]|nr:DUF2461 domain-containing protein [Phaeodactylibacter sp.]MCB9040148.1 DUF2461 domain-containing protein [Lewinellaceae bacterium]